MGAYELQLDTIDTIYATALHQRRAVLYCCYSRQRLLPADSHTRAATFLFPSSLSAELGF
jgi:hypothetical protein